MSDTPVVQNGPESEWDTDAQVTALVSAANGLDPVFHRPPFLKCFLRARKGDVDAASRLLLRHQEWRVANQETTGWPYTLNPVWPTIQTEVGTGKAYLRGRDKLGRPILIIRADLHLANAARDELERFVIFMIDSVVCLLHRDDLVDENGQPLPRADQFTALIDFSNFGYSNLDAEVAKLIVRSLSSHFPEHLGTMLMVNSGYIAYGLWQVIRLLLDARTERKIQFVSSTVLATHIDPAWIPSYLGGKDTYTFSPQDPLKWKVMEDGPLNPWLKPVPQDSRFFKAQA